MLSKRLNDRENICPLWIFALAKVILQKMHKQKTSTNLKLKNTYHKKVIK